jgi:hypothetical protein
MKKMLLGKFGFTFMLEAVSDIGNTFVGYMQHIKQMVVAAVKEINNGERSDPFHTPLETASSLKGGKKTCRKRLRRRRRTSRHLIMR